MARTDHIRFHAHRDRQLRSDRGSRRSLLGRADRTVAAEFPHRPGPDADADHSRARHRQAGRGANQSRTRADRPAPRPRHHPRRARGDRRQARRSFPSGGLADRLRHPDQHEPQRGDRQSRQRTARRQARRQGAGSSQRSRQHEPVVERLVPDRDAHRGGDRHHRRSRSGAEPAPPRTAKKGKGVRPYRQDRPHPYPGRDAADARPGIFRLRRAGREWH